MTNVNDIISKNLNISITGVSNTIQLLDEGCTIPFISRYRKERTGSLDEVQITDISVMYDKMKELIKRKETVIKTIEEQDKLTPELSKKINECWNANELEDIYLPYKPKRRTRAQIAREKGLEPLSVIIMMQREQNIQKVAERYVRNDVKNIEEALEGAKDIIAETISEDEQTRQTVRKTFKRDAIIISKVIKNKCDDEQAQKFSDYFDFQEPLKRCSSHRLLAMRRGENEGYLRISIDADEDDCIDNIKRHYIHGYGKCQQLIDEAINDSFKRLIKPSIETEFANSSKELADDEAIKVFAENLRQLLLAAPLGQKRVMGVDPGIRTGCKVVCLDAQGELIYHDVVFAVGDKASSNALSKFSKIANDYKIEAIAVGNGTASRETSDILRKIESIPTYVVSEDGASIYSASKIARDEFPEYDVTVRGAVSIGRRLMDPLAELVKLDPKSIGVGQYQHDVNQTKLKKALDTVIESCVNTVGVNLNTASQHLLTYVSGLGPTIAKNIVDYRKENGAFGSRTQLKKVARLGANAFEQCAGFLRIPDAKNPLDNSAVHPESYKVVEKMAKDNNCNVKDLINNREILKSIKLSNYITDSIGLPTLQDILKELEKPGLDPRDKIETFEFAKDVKSVEDLIIGMELPGIVTNITNFGAFVDVGVHQDGLIHISQMADRYIKDPNEIVKLHQHVNVKVLDVDRKRNRISLSMKR